MTGDHGDYKFTMISDLDRDGMFIELTATNGALVAEVFHSDVTGKMVVTLYAPLPLEVVEHLLSDARQRLPPLPDSDIAKTIATSMSDRTGIK
jgi:hypothetical protein